MGDVNTTNYKRTIHSREDPFGMSDIRSCNSNRSNSVALCFARETKLIRQQERPMRVLTDEEEIRLLEAAAQPGEKHGADERI